MPSNRPAAGTASIWEPDITAGPDLDSGLKCPSMMPGGISTTSNPTDTICARRYARAARSSSENVKRLTPSSPALKVASVSMSFQTRSMLIASDPIRSSFFQSSCLTKANPAATGGLLSITDMRASQQTCARSPYHRPTTIGLQLFLAGCCRWGMSRCDVWWIGVGTNTR